MTTYSWYEPTEELVCWGMFEAPTKRAALIAAVKSPDFKEWVSERRADRMPPFKGLQAKRPICEHGNCWGCDECAACLSTQDITDCPVSP